MFNLANLLNIINTSMGDDIKVTINSWYLYIPNLIPGVEIQFLFNEAIQKNYKTFFDEHYTERRVITDLLAQDDIGSTQQVNSPKYLICAHQTRLRLDTPNKKFNLAKFDNLDVQKFFIEVDGQRYPRDRSPKNYEETDYIEKYKDVKLFLKD